MKKYDHSGSKALVGSFVVNSKLVRTLFSGLFIVVGCLAGYESSAQKKWTLQECLDFAKLNNLAAQQSQVTKDKALVQLNTARSQFLPRVEFRARTIGNWGFIIDPSTNVLADRFNLGNQAALNVNLDLFNGFANHYQIKQRVKELEATRYGYESTLNNISLEVTYSYLQVLLAHEQWKNSQQRLGNLDTQQKQVTAQVQKGVLSKRDLLNLKSLIASEELLSVSAENSKERTLFELMQVMGLVNGEPIQIDTLNIPDLRFAIEVSQEDVLSAAADVLPDLKAARSKVEAARYSWRVARTNYAPSLYLGGQVATRTSNYKPESFDDQLVSNLNQQIGIYLNVPIFNRFAFRNSIGMAKLDIVSSQLSFQQIDVELKRKVISAYLSYKAAARKYQALVIQFEALIEENRYAERMLQLGSMNAIEYSLIRSRMVSTQSDLLQAKYDYFFRNKILDFYQGKPLSF